MATAMERKGQRTKRFIDTQKKKLMPSPTKKSGTKTAKKKLKPKTGPRKPTRKGNPKTKRA